MPDTPPQGTLPGQPGYNGTLPGFQPGDSHGTVQTPGTNTTQDVPVAPVPSPGTSSGGLSSILLGGGVPNTNISCPPFSIQDPLPSVSCFFRAQVAYVGVNFLALAFIVFGIYLLFKPEADTVLSTAGRAGMAAATDGASEEAPLFQGVNANDVTGKAKRELL